MNQIGTILAPCVEIVVSARLRRLLQSRPFTKDQNAWRK